LVGGFPRFFCGGKNTQTTRWGPPQVPPKKKKTNPPLFLMPFLRPLVFGFFFLCPEPSGSPPKPPPNPKKTKGKTPTPPHKKKPNPPKPISKEKCPKRQKHKTKKNPRTNTQPKQKTPPPPKPPKPTPQNQNQKGKNPPPGNQCPGDTSTPTGKKTFFSYFLVVPKTGGLRFFFSGFPPPFFFDGRGLPPLKGLGPPKDLFEKPPTFPGLGLLFVFFFFFFL